MQESSHWLWQLKGKKVLERWRVFKGRYQGWKSFLQVSCLKLFQNVCVVSGSVLALNKLLQIFVVVGSVNRKCKTRNRWYLFYRKQTLLGKPVVEFAYCRVYHWTLIFCSLLVSLNMQGSQWMLEYRVYVELPVTSDASYECYWFFYLPLNLIICF